MKYNFNLEGKTVFITGSTRGIGWESAKLLASAGANVIVNGLHDKINLENKIRYLNENYNSQNSGYLFDVSNYEEVKNFYRIVQKEYKKLDVLVNNAGILDDRLIGMITLENIDKTFNVNIKSYIYNIQYASKFMIRQKSGSVINISSIIGRFGNEGQVVYGASKAAVIGLTKSAAKELAKYNIRVNNIAPGFINTDMVKQLDENKFNERLNSIKMGRIGEPLDIAKTVLFLASDLSTYITGQTIGVDGGMLI